LELQRTAKKVGKPSREIPIATREFEDKFQKVIDVYIKDVDNLVTFLKTFLKKYIERRVTDESLDIEDFLNDPSALSDEHDTDDENNVQSIPLDNINDGLLKLTSNGEILENLSNKYKRIVGTIVDKYNKKYNISTVKEKLDAAYDELYLGFTEGEVDFVKVMANIIEAHQLLISQFGK